jgi:polysaccharide export outer membrane protein
MFIFHRNRRHVPPRTEAVLFHTKRTYLRDCLWPLGFVAVLALQGCAHPRHYVWGADYVREGHDKSPTVIRAGDRIQVLVSGQDSMNAEVDVRPNGEIVLPVAGSINAANLTPNDLANAIAVRINGIVAAPVVTVVVERHRTLVTVLGEVRTPGRFELDHREGVLNALARAGGLTPFAESDSVFVLRREPQLARIRFSYDDLTAADPTTLGFELRDGDIIVAE